MEDNHRAKLKSQLIDAHGRIEYTFVQHHIIANRLLKRLHYIKIAEILLTAISTVGFLATVIRNQVALAWLGGVGSAVALAITLYTKDFSLDIEAKKHKDAADALWLIREQYKSLISDFDMLTDEEVRRKRDELILQVSGVNKNYPGTDDKSFKKAQKDLKEDEKQTFHPGEAEKFLPPEQ
ncbi:MAG: SLATT domain-containing protein [Megasphaera sp.]|jgi:hypothetical protein|nr:SLATT domain-containing protein [Megasphaera sp.]